MKKYLFAIAVFSLALALSACIQPVPSVTETPTSPPAVVVASERSESRNPDVVSSTFDNCANPLPSGGPTERSYSTTQEIQLGASVSAEIKALIEAKLEAQFSIKNGQTIEHKQTIDMPVGAREIITYEVTWYETWKVGEVTVGNLPPVPYQARTGVRADSVAKVPGPCPTSTAPTPIPPSETPSPLPEIAAAATPMPLFVTERLSQNTLGDIYSVARDDTVAEYQVGDSMVVYDTGVINPRTGITQEAPIGVLRVVGRTSTFYSAQVILAHVDSRHQIRPNLRVDNQLADINNSDLIPAYANAAGYLLADGVIRLRPGVKVEPGDVLRALSPFLIGETIVDYLPVDPAVEMRVTTIGQEQVIVRVALTNQAMIWPPPGTLLQVAAAPTPPTQTPTNPPPDPPTLTPAATPQSVTLKLIAVKNMLVIVIPAGQSVQVSGLELRVVDAQNTVRASIIANDFSFLQLTSGMVDPQSCFIYRLAGTADPVPLACERNDRVIRREVAPSDVFWYDSVAEQARNVAVYRDGVFLTICSSAVPECSIAWEMRNIASAPTIPPTMTSTPTLTPTDVPTNPAPSATPGYPCPATVTGPGNRLNVVREKADPSSRVISDVGVGDAVTILEMRKDQFASTWYRIQTSGGSYLGWILDVYVLRSASCP